MTEILEVVSSDLLDYLVNQNSNVIPEPLIEDFTYFQNAKQLLDKDSLKTLKLAVDRLDWKAIQVPFKQLKYSGFPTDSEG